MTPDSEPEMYTLTWIQVDGYGSGLKYGVFDNSGLKTREKYTST
jgi:hypothetical protein